MPAGMGSRVVVNSSTVRWRECHWIVATVCLRVLRFMSVCGLPVPAFSDSCNLSGKHTARGGEEVCRAVEKNPGLVMGNMSAGVAQC